MNMKDTEASGPVPRALAVQRGLVLPPGVLRALLPDVASVVTNAMSAEHTKRAARPAASESQPQTTDAGKEPRHARNILNPFPCNICKQWFPTRQKLNVHLLRHDNKCDYCNTEFDSRYLLHKHMCCKFCNRLYKCSSEYNLHMTLQHGRLHSVFHKKSLQCSICKQSFSKKTDLIQHKYEMIFSCKKCKMCYRSSEEHVAHSKPARQPDSVQSEFSCNKCGECFEESLSFASHMRTHRGPVKSYSRAPKNPKLSANVTHSETRQESNVKGSEGIETRKKIIEKNVNEIDKRPGEDVNEKSDFREEPSEINGDLKNLDVTECDGIKVEPPELEFVSREARTNMYAGHQIHGGMALGPVRMLPPDIVYTIRNELLNKSNTYKQEPATDPLSCPSPTAEPCPVKLEPTLLIEEVDSKTWFPRIKTEDVL